MRATGTLKTGLRLLCATSVLSLTVASSAFAFDGNDVAERLKAIYAKQGAEITFEKVETDGSDVVLKGMKVSPADGKAPLNIGDLSLSDVTETDTGGFHVESLTMPDSTYPVDKGNVKVSGIEVQGLVIPALEAADPIHQFMSYDSATVEHIEVTVNDKKFIEIEDASATMSPFTKDAPVNFTSTLDSVKIDAKSLGDPKTTEALTALGYDTISGKMDITGSWTMADGQLKADKMDLTMDDGGVLGMTFDISGYTPEFIKGLQEATADAAKTDKPDEAAGLAMLGLVQQLNFNGASIRFDDASLTNRLLDYFAKQQGAERKDLVAQIKMILPMAAAQLQNAKIAEQVGVAANDYLDNPKSLEIRAAPEKPVPFAILAATGYAQPTALLETLNVSITANK